MPKKQHTARKQPSTRALTQRQRDFCSHILLGETATQAIVNAGYSDKSPHTAAVAMLKKPHVAAFLEKARRAMEHRTEVRADEVLREWARVGFSDILDYVEVAENGGVRFDWRKMPPGASRAIQSIEVEEWMDGKGKDARPVRRTRFRLHPKADALNALSRHLGLYARDNQRSVSVDVAILAVAERVSAMTAEQRAARIAELRGRMAVEQGAPLVVSGALSCGQDEGKGSENRLSDPKTAVSGSAAPQEAPQEGA